METVRAPEPETSSPPRCDTELLSFDLYVAAVIAESNRLFAARSGE